MSDDVAYWRERCERKEQEIHRITAILNTRCVEMSDLLYRKEKAERELARVRAPLDGVVILDATLSDGRHIIVGELEDGRLVAEDISGKPQWVPIICSVRLPGTKE
jgi:hypothetical protein